MNNELIKYARGELVPTRQDREVARAAREVFNEVRLAAVEVDGAFALEEHLTERAHEADAHRRSLSGQDAALDMLMAEFFATACRQAQSIQRHLFRRI